MSTISLSKLIQDWDTEKWLTGMKDKQTLAIYRRFKTKIKEETYFFTNNQASKLMFRARTNSLQLNWRNRMQREQNSQKCPNCNEEETLRYFLLECDAYNEIRAKFPFLSKPYKEDTDEIIGDFLLLKQAEIEDGISSRKAALKEMWKKRVAGNDVAT